MGRANTTTVDIVIIGIGTAAESASNWMDQIDCLDIADDKTDIYYVEQFESGDFNEIEEVIRNYTCSGEYLATPGDRGGAAWVYEDGSTGLGPVPTTDGNGNAPEDSTPSPVFSSETTAADAVPLSVQLPSALPFSKWIGKEVGDHIPREIPTVTLLAFGVFCILCCAFFQCCCRRKTKAYK